MHHLVYPKHSLSCGCRNLVAEHRPVVLAQSLIIRKEIDCEHSPKKCLETC